MTTEQATTIEPGVYPDIPIDEYHAGPGLSNSGIGHLLRSPLHYQSRGAFKQTEAMMIGAATHVAVLEPELFDSMYAAWDGPSRASNAGKRAWADWQLENVGKQELKPAQLKKIKAMAEAVHAHPAAKVLLTGGKREQSIYWIDEETGVLCKCRPDYILEDGTYVEFKTAKNASFEAFQKDAFNFEYHRQGEYYSEGIRQALKVVDKPVIWIVVENEAPHAVAVYIMDAMQSQLGEMEWRKGVAIYAECQKNDSWPGYPINMDPLGLPPWAMRKLQEDA